MIRKETAELLYTLYFDACEVGIPALSANANLWDNDVRAQNVCNWLQKMFAIELEAEQLTVPQNIDGILEFLAKNIDKDETDLLLQMYKYLNALYWDNLNDHKDEKEAMLYMLQNVSNAVTAIQNTLLKAGDKEED